MNLGETSTPASRLRILSAGGYDDAAHLVRIVPGFNIRVWLTAEVAENDLPLVFQDDFRIETGR